MTTDVLTVTAFNNMVQSVLQANIPTLKVEGEISKFPHGKNLSGHWYFSIKDEISSLEVSMFSNRNFMVDFEPREGDKVILEGRPDFYAKSGRLSFIATSMRKSGIGTILEKIEENRRKWQLTYFARPKRPVPKLVKNLFVITSMTGSVLRDIVRTRNIRMPSADIYIFPALMQGASCAESVSKMVKYANQVFAKVVESEELSSKYGFSYENSCLIVARGGGSFDDLLPFYDESVVKSFSESRMILISSIGHQTDHPLCNDAADREAATPTMAAEFALSDCKEEQRAFGRICGAMIVSIRRKYEGESYYFDGLYQKLNSSRLLMLQGHKGKLKESVARMNDGMHHICRENLQKYESLQDRFRKLYVRFVSDFNSLMERFYETFETYYEEERRRFSSLSDALCHISPKKVLERGYSIVRDGKLRVIDSKDALGDGKYSIELRDGHVPVEIKRRFDNGGKNV